MSKDKELLSEDEKIVINNMILEFFTKYRKAFDIVGMKNKIFYIHKRCTTAEYSNAIDWLTNLVDGTIIPMTKLLAQQTENSWLILEQMIDDKSDLQEFPEWHERIRLVKKFKEEYKTRPAAFYKAYPLCNKCKRGPLVTKRQEKYCAVCDEKE